MDKKDTTNRRINKAVKQSDKSQRQVAEEVCISKDYLHKIKLGIVDPPIRTLARIGHAVGQKLSDLKKRNGKKRR